MSFLVTPVLLLSAGVLQASAQTSRVVTFKNSCANDVWFYPTSGAAGNCSAGCPQGSSCNSANSICYWDNPTPSGGNYRVTAGQTNTVVYPFIDNGQIPQWNGNYGFCQSGTTCNTDESTCDSAGCLSAGPSSTAEFNIQKNASDYYDISIIAGVAVPMSITPQTVDSSNTDGTAYTCGNPGSPQPATQTLGAASWKVSVPSEEYNWVTPPSGTPTTCKANSDCASGQTCGTIFSSGQLTQVCGTLSGYWTANPACALEASSSLFNCSTALTNGPYTGTNAAFYGCGETSGSCYQNGADANCCGCANWNDVLGTSAVPSSTQQCSNQNTVWASVVQPTIQFLKEACPNCYTFPYDDMSSTFICAKNDANKFNTQNYTIELCPGGVNVGSS